MGNQQGKNDLKPQLYQSNLNQSQKGIYRKNAYTLKPGVVIYQPDSISGPQLKPVQIKDFNDYIKVKVPFRNLSETSKVDTSKQTMARQIDQSFLGYADGYKAGHQRHFQLRTDHNIGISKQAQMLSFYYEKKLQHYHPLPQRTTQGFKAQS